MASTSLLMSATRFRTIAKAQALQVVANTPLSTAEYNQTRSILMNALVENHDWDETEEHELLDLLKYDQLAENTGRWTMLSTWLHPHHWPVTRYPAVVLRLASEWML